MNHTKQSIRATRALELPVWPNYAGLQVALGLSGGINSMAMLCWLAQAPAAMRPDELHLIYHHFAEHSPNTRAFVLAGRAFAAKHFAKVVYHETDNSVLQFFEDSKMLPHPSRAPCTKYLKHLPTLTYMLKNGITHNPVGYVNSEVARRGGKMAKKTKSTYTDVVEKGIKIQFPIAAFDDEWCFEIVRRYIGWYPAIYDLRWNDAGFMDFMESRLSDLSPEGQREVRKRLGTNDRVFDHNNCLPCKNMAVWQLLCVEYFFPALWAAARLTEIAVGRHWGKDEQGYYAQFGYHERDPSAGSPCGVCAA